MMPFWAGFLVLFGPLDEWAGQIHQRQVADISIKKLVFHLIESIVDQEPSFFIGFSPLCSSNTIDRIITRPQYYDYCFRDTKRKLDRPPLMDDDQAFLPMGVRI